jgi:hypothetical protein
MVCRVTLFLAMTAEGTRQQPTIRKLMFGVAFGLVGYAPRVRFYFYPNASMAVARSTSLAVTLPPAEWVLSAISTRFQQLNISG